MKINPFERFKRSAAGESIVLKNIIIYECHFVFHRPRGHDSPQYMTGYRNLPYYGTVGTYFNNHLPLPESDEVEGKYIHFASITFFLFCGFVSVLSMCP